MPHYNKSLVDTYRRVAQEVLADFGLDPADAYRYAPDQLNAALERVAEGETRGFDIRFLLQKQGWTQDELADLEVNLSLAGQPLTYEAGEWPDPDDHAERR